MAPCLVVVRMYKVQARERSASPRRTAGPVRVGRHISFWPSVNLSSLNKTCRVCMGEMLQLRRWLRLVLRPFLFPVKEQLCDRLTPVLFVGPCVELLFSCGLAAAFAEAPALFCLCKAFSMWPHHDADGDVADSFP